MTASAVSNQIRALEDQLGLALFARGARALQLTEAGAHYYAQIDHLFERLHTVSAQLQARFGKQLLRLAAPPLFASELLLSRLDALSSALGSSLVSAQGSAPGDRLTGVDIQLSTVAPPHAEHGAEADVSVLVGNGQWPALYSAPLFEQRFVAAAAPRLLEEQPLASLGELADRPLLTHSRRLELWDLWAELNGIAPLVPRQRISLDSMTAVVGAAEQGAGIALVSAPLAEQRFARGTLARLPGAELVTGEAYHLVARHEDLQRPAVRALLEWLRAEYAVG